MVRRPVRISSFRDEDEDGGDDDVIDAFFVEVLVRRQDFVFLPRRDVSWNWNPYERVR